MSNELNVFQSTQEVGRSATGVTAAMATTRQAQEVQAAMVVAKKFPRDEERSLDRILKACQRPTLAAAAMYSFPRGGQEVKGPSIRLAECLAQQWGNIDFGFIELESDKEASQVMAYAWDLETNTRQSKVFSVPHRRDTKRGSIPLTDSRDIYELVANQASRRVRSCILAVIPGDVIDAAIEQCDRTLKAGSKDPLNVRIQKMVSLFQTNYAVSPNHLRDYIGKNVEAFSEQDVVRLGRVYQSIRDGIAGPEKFFDGWSDAVNTVPEPNSLCATETDGADEFEDVNLDDL